MTKLIRCTKLYNCKIEYTGVQTNSEDEIIRPIVIMKTGVFNGYLKTVKALLNSVKWWEGIPIVINKDATDHPTTVIVTNNTQKVGQIINPRWDITRESIIADAHIYPESCPEWLLQPIMNGEELGVSGTYFADLVPKKGELDGKKYTHEEQNYTPNNVAIVKFPACKLPECGLNVNSDQGVETMAKSKTCKSCGKPIEDCTDDEPITDADGANPDDSKDEPEGNDSTKDDNKTDDDPKGKKGKADKNKKIKVNDKKDSNVIVKDSEGDNMVTLEELQKQLTDITAITNTQKEEIKTLKEENDRFKAVEKENGFLAQFPADSRAAAKLELWPAFQKDPASLIMNSATAKRLGELLVPINTLDKSVGAAMVDLPLKDAVMNADKDDVLSQMPSLEDSRKLLHAMK